MKVLIFLLLILPIIYLAFKKKKWYLYLSFAFLVMLPSTFAIKIGDNLPMITATRLLILILLCFWIYTRHIRGVTTIPKELLFFVIANIIIAIVNLHYGLGELNRVFILFFEQLFLVVIIKDLIDDKEELNCCIDFMLYGSMVLAIIGIVQTLLGYDIGSILNIAGPGQGDAITDRMGMTRAYGTSNAIAYGCYCAFMVPIALYRYEKTKKEKYIVPLIMNFVALICTMSRSSLLALGIVLFLMLLVRKGDLIKPFIKYVPIVLIGIVVLVYKKPDMVESVLEVGKSIFNVLGANFELSDKFGLNANNATYSRMVQWSTLEYMIDDGSWLFGYGYNAYVRGMLHYFYKQFGFWTVATTLDVGFVRILGETGIIGLMVYFIFLGVLLLFAIRNWKKIKNFDFYNLSFYLIILYVILNIASSFISTEAFWLFVSMFYAYRELEGKNSRRKLSI